MENNTTSKRKIQSASKKPNRIQLIQMGIGVVTGITIYLFVKLLF